MKRELEESPDDERRQASIAALVQADFTFGLREIPELLRAFRFHPQRLLRLTQASSKFQAAVQRAERDFPRLWYDCCLCTFPDLVILLQVYSPADYDTKKIDSPNGWFQWLSSIYDRQLYFSDASDPIDVASRLVLLRRHLAGGLSCSEDRIDRSFHAPDLVAECLRDEGKAWRTAECFKLLVPFGVPPAQYCFASQLALHHLTLAWLTVTSGSQKAVLFNIGRLFTLTPSTAVDTRARDWMPRVTLQLCEHVRAAGLQVRFVANGAGPRTGIVYPGDKGADIATNAHFVGHVFGLRDLFVMAQAEYDTLMKPQDAMQVRAGGTYLSKNDRDRAAKASLIEPTYIRIIRAYARYAPEIMPELPQLVDADGESKLGLDEIHALRQRDMDRYGTHDPLQWRVLLGGEEDAFTLAPDWKAVVMDAIATVKKLMPGSGEALKLEQHPSTQLSCTACGRHGVDYVEEVAPFGSYCNSECQKTTKRV